MANYKVRFKKSVAKDFRPIPEKEVMRILGCIDRLSVDPQGEGCIKLAGKDCYRVRIGSYRIVYEIRDAVLIIIVINVAHRSSVYK